MLSSEEITKKAKAFFNSKNIVEGFLFIGDKQANRHKTDKRPYDEILLLSKIDTKIGEILPEFILFEAYDQNKDNYFELLVKDMNIKILVFGESFNLQTLEQELLEYKQNGKSNITFQGVHVFSDAIDVGMKKELLHFIKPHILDADKINSSEYFDSELLKLLLNRSVLKLDEFRPEFVKALDEKIIEIKDNFKACVKVTIDAWLELIEKGASFLPYKTKNLFLFDSYKKEQGFFYDDILANEYIFCIETPERAWELSSNGIGKIMSGEKFVKEMYKSIQDFIYRSIDYMTRTRLDFTSSNEKNIDDIFKKNKDAIDEYKFQRNMNKIDSELSFSY